METETNPDAWVDLRVPSLPGATIPVRLRDLPGMVQQAYDEHGILATPSYDREAGDVVADIKAGRVPCSSAGACDNWHEQ